jgi:hypothetical protein
VVVVDKLEILIEERLFMVRMIRFIFCVSIIAAGLIFCGLAGRGGRAADPPAKRTAEALAREWTFDLGATKVRRWGIEPVQSGNSLAAVTFRIQDKGQAQVWFARAARFYAEKCGSDVDPVKKSLGGESDENQSKARIIVNEEGENQSQGRYLIREPGLLSMLINEIPARPNEFLFASHNADSTVTVDVRQQGEDVVLIMLTAAVR